MQFRFGTDDDVVALSELVGRHFDDGPGTDTAQLQLLAYRAIPSMSPTTCWLAEDDDGVIVARWQVVPHEMTVRGVALPTGGALGVAVDAERRTPELVRAFLDSCRTAFGAMGMPVHVGFVEQGGLWSALGAVPIQPRYRAHLDATRFSPRFARALQALPTDPEGLVMAPDGLGAIVHRHNRQARLRTGALQRDPLAYAFGRHRPRELFVGPGVHLGYTCGDTLHVLEAEADDPRDHVALLATAAQHARERGLPLTADLPPDHGFIAAARDRGVEMTITWPRRSQCMALVVDGQDLLDRLAPAVPEGAITWEVEDGPHTWVMDRGGPTVRARCTSGAMLQLLMGYASASDLRSARRLDCSDDEAARLDALFGPQHPFTCASDRF